jgi:hypothetical protein
VRRIQAVKERQEAEEERRVQAEGPRLMSTSSSSSEPPPKRPRRAAGGGQSKVMPSSLLGGGDGCYTTIDLRPGQFIYYYFGQITSTNADIACTNTDYVYMNCDARVAEHCPAKFMNDPRCDFCVNVKISATPSHYISSHVYYECVASCYIYAGSELFVSYGSEYWASPARQHLLSDKMKRNVCSFDYKTCTHNYV